MKLLCLVLLLPSLMSLCHELPAQTYPGKAVRMVVGFPPGGGTDIVARLIQPRLTEYLRQSVVIENRPGATGTVAAGIVAKAAGLQID